MTTETILTDDQIDSLLEGVLRASGSRLGNYTYQKTLDELRSSIRTIEQAVLQSPEVQALKHDLAEYIRIAAEQATEIQALRKDAERYQWLRAGGDGDIGVVIGFDCIDVGSTAVVGTYGEGLDGEHLDEAIDDARRVEGEGE